MNTGEHISDYVVERVLGEGGMGTVYLARHTVLDQQVAIKILDPEVARKPGVQERFIQEANIQAKLKHPHIVQVLTATKTDSGTPALIMEYVEGKSLSEVLELRGALPVDDALKIMQQVLSAVGYAHRQNVIHRDLKPSNVMVMASGEVKVTDFGIAKVLGSSKLTRTGTAIGSAPYMSPEQIRRPETVDARSDIYSLGCMFYELLVGRPPFGESTALGTDSDFEIKEGHVRGQIPHLRTTRQDVPDWLERLVMQSLAKGPDKRPSICEEILVQIKEGNEIADEKASNKQGEKTVFISGGSSRSAAAKKPVHKIAKSIPRRFIAIALMVTVCASIFFILGKESYRNFIESEVTENTGNFVINPQFDDASNFSEGLAAVRIGDFINGKHGFIDKEGRMLISPQFEDAASFSEGLARVRVGNLENSRDGFIDKAGKMIITPEFSSAGNFSDGMASVQVGDWETGKYGFINKEGKMVISPQFDQVNEFYEGLANVRIGDDETGKWGFINKEGKMIIPPQFDEAFPFFEGLATIRIGDDKTGKWGFINKEGKMIIPPQFDEAYPFFEGLAAIRIGDDKTGKYGFINKEGKIVITPQFDAVSMFSEGLASFRIGDDSTGKWGFIKKDGKIVISPQFVGVEHDIKGAFRDGLVAVRVDDGKSGKKGFIARR